VHVGLPQPGKNFGAVEICLNEMAPAERTLINMHEKINFFAIKEAPFTREKAGLSDEKDRIIA